MSSWFGATALVLGLILLLARAARWWFDRRGPVSGPVEQLGRWRVAPDAHLRALRIGDSVSLVLETRQGISTLRTMERAAFDEQFASKTAPAALGGVLPLLRQAGLAVR